MAAVLAAPTTSDCSRDVLLSVLSETVDQMQTAPPPERRMTPALVRAVGGCARSADIDVAAAADRVLGTALSVGAVCETAKVLLESMGLSPDALENQVIQRRC